MFIDLLILGREREELGRGGERERNMDWLPPIHTETWDWTHSLDICPDWESNLQPFGVPKIRKCRTLNLTYKIAGRIFVCLVIFKFVLIWFKCVLPFFHLIHDFMIFTLNGCKIICKLHGPVVCTVFVKKCGWYIISKKYDSYKKVILIK